MLRFVFILAKAIKLRTTLMARYLVESDFGTCGKPGYGELDSPKMVFGRFRLETWRVKLERVIGPLFF